MKTIMIAIYLILFALPLSIHSFKNIIDVPHVTNSIKHIVVSRPTQELTNKYDSIINKKKLLLPSLIVAISVLLSFPTDTFAVSVAIPTSTASTIAGLKEGLKDGLKGTFSTQSPGWEKTRQKRTIAIKKMEQQGIVKVIYDDKGNEFLKLPWIPGDPKIPYKSLSVQQRLINEVCAGAFGEIAKDVLLHALDTVKTRKQAVKANTGNTVEEEPVIPKPSKPLDFSSHNDDITMKGSTNPTGDNDNTDDVAVFMPKLTKSIREFKGLYRGFPIVLASSIPQGGSFFLVKKGAIEIFSTYYPNTPEILTSTVPIVLAVMAYWLFRTPAEVIKTQVQTGQSPSVADAISLAKVQNSNGYFGLWKYYQVMLTLDIPFQMINFVLFGIVTNAVSNAGYDQSFLTRLFCGIFCGMIAAGITCPIDVCKTRIISKDKERQLRRSSNSNGDNTTAMAEDEEEVNNNVIVELTNIARDEGASNLFRGLKQRLFYTGLANGIRLSAYGTSRMDLMMKLLDDL